MKNLFTSKSTKISSDLILLFILLEFILFIPIKSYSQNNPTPIPLSGFSCHFTNLDGHSVISCASIVKATISFPVVSSPIERIKLIYPNTFQIIDVEGGLIDVSSQGQELFTWHTNQKQEQINLSSIYLQNGIYILHAVSQDGKISTQKFNYTKQ
jgi:hypothetical protein